MDSLAVNLATMIRTPLHAAHVAEMHKIGTVQDFAPGDVRAGSVKRVASAVGEGSVVISKVWDYLKGWAGAVFSWVSGLVRLKRLPRLYMG